MESADGTLDGVLGLAVVLVLTNGSGEVEGKVLINDMVDSICEGLFSVKKAKLLWGNGGRYIISGGRRQGASLNGVSTPIGARDAGGITVSEIVADEGGDDEVFGGQVRNEKPVVVFSKGVVQFPTLSGVCAADRQTSVGGACRLLQGVSWVVPARGALARCHHCNPIQMSRTRSLCFRGQERAGYAKGFTAATLTAA